MMRDRLVSRHFRFALNSFGRDLERPGKRQRNRKPNNNDEDDNLHRPLRRIERGKKNRCRLNEEPRHNRVGDGYFVNITPFQLGKEAVDLHLDFSSQSFWKRGSFRSGSNIGSSRSSAGVSGTFSASAPEYGIESSFCKAEMARSGSPICAATRARISTGRGPDIASFSIGFAAIDLSMKAKAATLSPRPMLVSARSPIRT